MNLKELLTAVSLLRVIDRGEWDRSLDLRPFATLIEGQWIRVTCRGGVVGLKLTQSGRDLMIANP